jgi:ABC-type transporter Mla subunit MlaD
MQLNSAASNVVVIWYLVASILNILALAGLVFGLAKLSAQLSELSSKVDPLLTKADTVLSQANDQLDRIGTTTGHVLDKTEAIATTVQDTTAKTSNRVSRLIYTPFVSAQALLTGVSEGAKAFSRRSRQTPQNKQRG